MFQHEQYNVKGLVENDIALINLPRPVNLTKTIQVACLPQKSSDSYPSSNQSAWILGWGDTVNYGNQTYPDILQNARMTVNDGNTKCDWAAPITNGDWSERICAGVDAGGIGVCSGDSGLYNLIQKKIISIYS